MGNHTGVRGHVHTFPLTPILFFLRCATSDHRFAEAYMRYKNFKEYEEQRDRATLGCPVRLIQEALYCCSIVPNHTRILTHATIIIGVVEEPPR